MSNSPIKEVLYHSEEDKIIESLVLEGLRRLYDDSDFLPIRQSLYNIENVIPLYDDEISASITWCRPSGISDAPVYFNNTNRVAVVQGNLPDEVFLGALMAVCTYPKYDLMEYIFSSRPDDFKRHGIFTCRFYVEGDWVEVITDTNIPCLRDDLTNIFTPVYSRSIDPDEMWICLVEKAYAKAVGSYEAIPRVRIQEALMHMTGGSVQQLYINEDVQLKTGNKLWELLRDHLDSYVMILTSPTPLNLNDEFYNSNNPVEQISPSHGSYDDLQHADLDNFKQPNQFQLNHFYSVILIREYYKNKLVLLHNPWSKSIECWYGKYSNANKKFWSESQTNQKILDKIQSDSSIPWSIDDPKGYFWMEYNDFQIYFNNTFFCKLFPSNIYKFYCIKGEWREKQAGGPLIHIRDKFATIQAFNESKKYANEKASAVTIVDGDSSWFNNPQIRIHSNTATKFFISVLPLSGDKDGSGIAVGVDVVEVKKAVDGSHINQLHVWDGTLANVIASDKVDLSSRSKGQEASVWSLDIKPHHYYNIIPHTMKRGSEGYYLLRIFSLDTIVVEQIPSLYINTLHGDWHRVHDANDTTGGPLRLTYENGKVRENPKWCQNPQFHLELQDLYSNEEVKIKIVVRRTDKAALLNHRPNQSTAVTGTNIGSGLVTGANTEISKSSDTMVGLTVCLAKSLEDNVARNKKKKQPRLTAVGELIPEKVSTLKKPNPLISHSTDDHDNPIALVRKEKYDITKILRQYSLLDEIHVFESSYSSRTESCIYFPKISRSLIPQGLIITPSLNEKGVKGTYEIEIYSSEPMNFKQLPDNYSKSLSYEWNEHNSFGNHMNQNYRKNPRFHLSFRHVNPQMIGTRIPIRITLSRYGLKWKMLCKKDPIGCMIGFYIFINRHNINDMTLAYESPFVPTEELCTDSSFTLEALPSGDEYIIIPTTFSEGKAGNFVISVMTEVEFKFNKEK